MEEFVSKVTDLAVEAGGKIIIALLIFIIGRMIINRLVRLIQKGKAYQKLDPTVQEFTKNFVKVGLDVVMVISIISVLGVPMTSVITVLASCGLAVGMALQGALSNLAGGIMLLVFRPFNVGDYIVAAGDEGSVRAITLFYTSLVTPDNKSVTIPNGSLMNANVTNCSSEPTRRVDLQFALAKSEDPAKVEEIMLNVMNANEKIMKDPAPFANINGGTNEAVCYTVRAWCKGADYWDVYFALNEDITKALGAAGVQGPAVRVIRETK